MIDWQNNISKPIATHPILVVALCSAFTGPLLAPLEQYSGAGLHLKGQSSKGKTTALYLACSVWGKPDRYCKTWKSTVNALEHIAYMHNDGFLALDEIGEAISPLELGHIAYMLANGKGKSRLTKQITARPSYTWKLLFLSTGEKGLGEDLREHGVKVQLGQEVRFINIDISQFKYGVFSQIDFSESAAKQSRILVERTNQFYGVAGIQWLNYLTANKEAAIASAKKLLEQYHKELVRENTEGHVVRVANIFALMAVAGELATKAGITGWKLGTALNAVKEVFQTWLNDFEYMGDYKAREYILSIKAFLEANGSSQFETISSDKNVSEKIFNRVGYITEKNGEKLFLIFPEQFKNIMCKGFDSREVVKTLLDKGMLEHDSGTTSKNVHIPFYKKVIKFYAIKESIFSYGVDS